MSEEQTTKQPISVAYVRVGYEPLGKMCSMCMTELTGKDNIVTSMGKYICFECYGGELSKLKEDYEIIKTAHYEVSQDNAVLVSKNLLLKDKLDQQSKDVIKGRCGQCKYCFETGNEDDVYCNQIEQYDIKLDSYCSEFEPRAVEQKDK